MYRIFYQFTLNVMLVSLIVVTAGAVGNQNEFSSDDPNLVNGAVGVDTLGHFRTLRDPSAIDVSENALFEVNDDGIPTQFYNANTPYFLGFDVYRDIELIANPDSEPIGFFALDKFAGVHPLVVSAAAVVTGAAENFDYSDGVLAYNASKPANEQVYLPYFGYFTAENSFMGMTLDDLGFEENTGGDNAIARDIEVAVDWRSATNAFQGYYILDAFGGVHYVNNVDVLGFLRQPTNQNVQVTRWADSNGTPIVQEPLGYQIFFDIFKFRPQYLADYVGESPSDQEIEERGKAAYFPGLPIARDLEVLVRFEEMDPSKIVDSQLRNQRAEDEGINELYTPIEIDENRIDISTEVFTQRYAVTNGYAILDGYGSVHALVEDENGEPIPAPWENIEEGIAPDAPYFMPYDIAVDIEVFPNGQGFCMLLRTGDVFVVNAIGTTSGDNFVTAGIESLLPSFGFDVARNLTLVPDETGRIKGMYVIDRFGSIHKAGDVPSLPDSVLYFKGGNSLDLETSPYVSRYMNQ